MRELNFTTLLLRYGEISLKSDKVRRRFEKQLADNIKYVLDKEKIAYKLERLPLQGRFFIHTDKIEETAKILSDVFGIVSISPVKITSSELSVIIDEGLNFADVLIKKNNSFAIRVRRSGQHEYTSQDVANEVGAFINKKFTKRNIKVDLNNPDVTIFIEIRGKWAYIFKDIITGLSGFPYNSQDNLVSLFFGDFNSFISTWLMLRKGCRVIPIFFNFSMFANQNLLNQIIEIAQNLKKYTNSDKFHIYEIPDCRKLIESDKSLKNVNKFQINLQLMFLVAERIAILENARGIVTYHTFSDIFSLKNLNTIENLVKSPIFRPLLGKNLDNINELMDKFENIPFINKKDLFLNLNENKKMKFQDLNQLEINSIQDIVEKLIKNAKKIEL
ncbi:MAG: tRNA sulfurtransferase [Candidatus Hodarchaeota archaeon]